MKLEMEGEHCRGRGKSYGLTTLDKQPPRTSHEVCVGTGEATNTKIYPLPYLFFFNN